MELEAQSLAELGDPSSSLLLCRAGAAAPGSLFPRIRSSSAEAGSSLGSWGTITEGTDSVHVTVPRRVVQPGVIRLLVDADQRYQLTQRERITFALIGQTEGVSAADLVEELELPDAGALRPWLGRLPTWGLVEQSGRTKATRYFVPPALLREAGLDALTTLTRVQPHRLRALILEDLERFPDSLSKDIHRRVGPEIPDRTFRRALETLVESGQVQGTGETRWRRYRSSSLGHVGEDGQ
jgi:ATP-dependent DNA helicase RecG